jgi:hypothetical protein
LAVTQALQGSPSPQQQRARPGRVAPRGVGEADSQLRQCLPQGPVGRIGRRLPGILEYLVRVERRPGVQQRLSLRDGLLGSS